MMGRNALFATLVTGLYALFLVAWLMAPAELTTRPIAGPMTTSMLLALLFIVLILVVAALYLRRPPSE
jgi:DMSO/TMAO reductase YedYZ heme-binding membrane subunit